MMENIMGTIKLFSGNFVPQFYLACDGSLMSISANQALYSLLGTMYGGDGITTFALPDLRGRIPVGSGQGPELSNYEGGQKGGSENNTLAMGNLPNHTHSATLNVSATNATLAIPTTNSSIAVSGSNAEKIFEYSLSFNVATPNIPMNPSSIQLGATGGSLPVNNMPPYLGLLYIICVQGIYPSRQF